MKFQRKKIATALAYAMGVGGVTLLAATSAQAQTQTAAADIKVEVTGSNIKRVEGEGALPVTIMTREEIKRTGATTPMELLQSITANTSAGQTSFANVIGATTFSQQTASLRGLGPTRTLVLVNGKRVVGLAGAVQGVENGVDLSLIPLEAIERVEVLKDGASAIYGSDAIGGVINFIMRQDYTGIEGTAYYGVPTRSGGGSQYILSGTAGFGDLNKDRYNAFFSLSYNEQKPLNQNDRDFSNTSIRLPIGLFGGSGNTFPAYISTGGIGSPGYPGNCGAANYSVPPEFTDILGARCYFDPSQMAGVEMIPDTKLWNFFAQGRFQINRDWQAYVTGMYSRQENNFIIQPTPISDQFLYGPNGDIPAQILLPPSSPFYPHDLASAAGVDGQPLNVRYRCVAVRTAQHDRHDRRRPDHRRHQGHRDELGLGRIVPVRGKHDQGKDQRRLRVVLADPADPEQRQLQPVRHEPAERPRPDRGHRVPRPGVRRQVEELRRERQDVRRNLATAGRPDVAGRRRRSAQGRARPDAEFHPRHRRHHGLRRQPAAGPYVAQRVGGRMPS